MSVTLTPELEAMIQERVESGRYSDASEVVRDALHHLEEHERLKHLRTLLEVGRQDELRGDFVEYTPEWVAGLAQRVEERFLRGDEPNPDVCPYVQCSPISRSRSRCDRSPSVHPASLGREATCNLRGADRSGA